MVVMTLRLSTVDITTKRLLNLNESHLGNGVTFALVFLLPSRVAALEFAPGCALKTLEEGLGQDGASTARRQFCHGPFVILLHFQRGVAILKTKQKQGQELHGCVRHREIITLRGEALLIKRSKNAFQTSEKSGKFVDQC